MYKSLSSLYVLNDVRLASAECPIKFSSRTRTTSGSDIYLNGNSYQTLTIIAMNLEGLAEMVQAAAALQATIREPRWRREDRMWRKEDQDWRREDREWRSADLCWRQEEMEFMCVLGCPLPSLHESCVRALNTRHLSSGVLPTPPKQQPFRPTKPRDIQENTAPLERR
jgi:hypothetical protein